MRHVLVDDVQSLRAAGVTDGAIWSCSAGLAQILARENVGSDVASPEALIDSNLHDSLGRAVLKARSGIHAALATQEHASNPKPHFAATHVAQLYALFLLFATKGLILRKWLEATEKYERVVIGCPALSDPQGLSMQVGIHDHVFAAIVHEMTSQADESPSLLSVPRVDARKFWAEFERVPAFDKAFNIVNRSGSSVAYQIWRRVSTEAGRGDRGTILLLSSNEGIEECFLPILRRGWRIVRLDQQVDLREAGDSEPPDLSRVQESLRDEWEEAVSAFLPRPISEACWNLLYRRAVAVLSRHAAYVTTVRERVSEWRRELADTAGPVAVLSSGLYAPVERLIDASLREVGFPVVCTDHGTAKGLGLRHDYNSADSVSFGDYYLAYNAETKKILDGFRRSDKQIIRVVGTPAIISHSRFPRVQRWAARMRLGVKGRNPTLLYVTSLAKNNLPQGYGVGTDHVYAQFQQRLVNKFDHFNGNVVIKPYPAHRFADPDQVWTMPTPANTSVAPFGEFRHLRWAADILLLDICASTMGWAMGSGVPIIYVDNPHTPLTRRAAAALRDSVFLVDALAPGWEVELGELLATPMSELRARWEDMAPVRAKVSEQFVLGRTGGFAKGVVRALDDIGTGNAEEIGRGQGGRNYAAA